MAVAAATSSGPHGSSRARPGLLVVVEGPTGVGKTTLVRRLHGALDARALFDPYEANPFLPSLCAAGCAADAARAALPTELAFVALRVNQLRKVAGVLAAGGSVLADWSFAKQVIFAGLSLGQADRDRLAMTCQIWCADLPVPDLVVHLRADAATLRRRIQTRARLGKKEFGTSDADLVALSAAYDAEFAGTQRPVLTIDAARLDVFDDGVIAALAERIRQTVAEVRSRAA